MIRKTTEILIVLVLIISGFSGLTAFEGLNNIEEGTINGFPMVRGVSDSGTEVVIIKVVPEINEDLELRVLRLLGSFTVVPVKSIRVTVKSANSAELFISNGIFQWKGMNMADYLPSGFTLKLDGVVDYDANVFVDKLNLRLKGFYSSEEEFLDKIVSVIKDPGSFLMSRDPEYILNTFISMTSADEEIKAELETQKSDSSDSLDALKAELAELKAEFAELTAEKSSLESKVEELQYNNLIMENRSLFGGIRMIDRTAVEWIVDKKLSDPSMTAEALSDGVLAATGAVIKAKQMTLILALYFGVYPE